MSHAPSLASICYWIIQLARLCQLGVVSRTFAKVLTS